MIRIRRKLSSARSDCDVFLLTNKTSENTHVNAGGQRPLKALKPIHDASNHSSILNPHHLLVLYEGDGVGPPIARMNTNIYTFRTERPGAGRVQAGATRCHWVPMREITASNAFGDDEGQEARLRQRMGHDAASRCIRRKRRYSLIDPYPHSDLLAK